MTPVTFIQHDDIATFGLCFATVALAVGGITGRRTFSLAVSAGVAVVTYLLNAIVSQIKAISGEQVFSPFYYYYYNNNYVDGDRLRNGYAVIDLVVLILSSAVLLAVTLIVSDRRDLNV